jgi:hypothetical protein
VSSKSKKQKTDPKVSGTDPRIRKKCHRSTTLGKRINILLILKLFIKFVSVTRWSSVLAALDIFLLHSVVPLSESADLYPGCNISVYTAKKRYTVKKM